MINRDNYLATGFRDVDNNGDVGKLVACLTFIDALPSFKSYKRISMEQLRLEPGHTAVDAGCGLGFDVARISEMVSPGGSSIGIDNSEKLLHAARKAFGAKKGVSFMLGDIHNLDMPANSVDAIRVDRTLQHVQDPQKVISEMVRVLKPGGWLVCAEPDWSTFIMDADGDDTTNTIIETWQNGFQNPHIGWQLLRKLRAEELQNTWADGRILLADGMNAVDTVFDIYATAEKVKADKPERARSVDKWLDALQTREGRERVVASVTIFLAGGQKCK